MYNIVYFYQFLYYIIMVMAFNFLYFIIIVSYVHINRPYISMYYHL